MVLYLPKLPRQRLPEPPAVPHLLHHPLRNIKMGPRPVPLGQREPGELQMRIRLEELHAPSLGDVYPGSCRKDWAPVRDSQ